MLHPCPRTRMAAATTLCADSRPRRSTSVSGESGMPRSPTAKVNFSRPVEPPASRVEVRATTWPGRSAMKSNSSIRESRGCSVSMPWWCRRPDAHPTCVRVDVTCTRSRAPGELLTVDVHLERLAWRTMAAR